MTDREKLTEEERDYLRTWGCSVEGAKALRIIDAHEADRAALVKEVERQKKLVELAELSATAHRCKAEELGKERNEALEAYRLECNASDIARAEVARLAEALDEERCERVQMEEHESAEVARLTTERDDAREGDGYWHAAAVAEGKAKLRAEGELRMQERATQQLSAEVARLTEALALATDRGDDWQAIAERDLKRAEAAEQKLAATEKERDEWKYWRSTAVKACDKAEARVRELEAAMQRDASQIVDGWDEVHARLATANTLLRQVHAEQAPTVSLLCAIGDHLAKQPAAPETDHEGRSMTYWGGQTAAEQEEEDSESDLIGQVNRAEARVRELDEAGQANVREWRKAESELAQLRERVAEMLEQMKGIHNCLRDERYSYSDRVVVAVCLIQAVLRGQ